MELESTLMRHINPINLASKSTKPPFQRSLLRTCLCTFSVLLGTACSSGGGGGGGGESETTDPDSIVVTTSSEALRSNASDTFGASLDDSLTGFQTLDDDGENLSLIDDDTRDLLITSLGLEADSTAETLREEERITIDPDEFMLCAELAGDGGQTIEEGQRCVALLADLSVDLVASDEAAGSITYLFQDSPFIAIGYGNDQDEIKFDLNGLKLLSDANDALDPELAGETSTPEVFDGELTITAITTSNEPGQEAGEISIAVSRALAIADADTNFSLQPGELINISTDAATGAGSISYEVGALALSAPSGADSLSLTADGFTGSAMISEQGDQLTVSNLGIGNGPLEMRINSVEALTLTMQTFGFTVLGDNGVDGSDPEQTAEIVIDGAMDVGLFVSNAFDLEPGMTEAITAMVGASAPGGTIFSTQQIPDGFGFVDDALRVDSGGPFIFNLSASDGESDQSETLTVNAGECLQATSNDDDSVLSTGMSDVVDSMMDDEDGLGLNVIECL